MTIDWTAFTPWHALAGGLAIGVASALYLLGVGRIAGIAGIVGEPLRCLWVTRFGRAPAVAGAWRAHRTRLAFIVGLLMAPWVWRLFAPMPSAAVDVGTGGLVAAGLLVGVGSRKGNGCTSGHGVCGLSRLSLRSLVNVLAFMAAGFASVGVLRHLLLQA